MPTALWSLAKHQMQVQISRDGRTIDLWYARHPTQRADQVDTENMLLMTANWLPVAEACRRSRLSRERLMRRLYAGKIAAEMRFGRWCVSAESLDAYLRNHASESSAA